MMKKTSSYTMLIIFLGIIFVVLVARATFIIHRYITVKRSLEIGQEKLNQLNKTAISNDE